MARIAGRHRRHICGRRIVDLVDAEVTRCTLHLPVGDMLFVIEPELPRFSRERYWILFIGVAVPARLVHLFFMTRLAHCMSGNHLIG